MGYSCGRSQQAGSNQLLQPADLLHSFPKADPLNRWQVHPAVDTTVPMRDGMRLGTDIWRPAHGGGTPVSFSVPVLLVRSSYDKQAPEWDDVVPYVPFLVRRGVAVAIQDVRPRYRSEGDGTYYHTCNPWEGMEVAAAAAQRGCGWGATGRFGCGARGLACCYGPYQTL
jgi:predicted acyl esterase